MNNPSSKQVAKHLYEQERNRWLEEEQLRFYVPQSYQEPFHLSERHRRLVHGGVRSGKTVSVCAHIIWSCIGTDFGTSWASWVPPWVKDIKTPQFWRACSDGMNESVLKVLVEWFKKMTPREFLEGGEFNYSQSTHILRFKNGSWVEFMSYDQEEGKASGRPLHGVWMDESHKCPRTFRKQCLNRLIDYHGTAIASCCPEDGITWETEWYDLAQAGDPDTAAFQFPTVENEYMYPDRDKSKPSPAIEQIKKDYDHDERLLRVVLHGDFIAIGGLIYEMLHAQTHKLASIDVGVQPDWPVYVSIDPGIQKPHAVIWAKCGPGTQLHVFREAEVGRESVTQTMKELAWEIRFKSKDERIAGFCFDPNWDWNNKTVATATGEPFNLEKELRKALDEVGYTEVPLYKARKDRLMWFGIDQVKALLRKDESIKRPLLTFDPENVEMTWNQMRKYQCVPQKQTQQDAHRPRIRKVDDDFCDCIRILVTSPVEFAVTGGSPKLFSNVSYDDYGLGF